ncbi:MULTISPECIES: hypothetical protein [Chitinophagaceae]
MIVYKYIDGSKKEIDLGDVVGIKVNNLVYCAKKRLVRYRQEDKYGVDSIFDFFPLENGRYQRNTMQIINKDAMRFYKIADEMNATTSYSAIPGGAALGGAVGGAIVGAAGGGLFRDVPYAYYFEKNNSGELIEIPRKKNIGSNILDGWQRLRQDLSDNPDIQKKLDAYIAENKKANKSNIEAIILDYTGMDFDKLPKIKMD